MIRIAAYAWQYRDRVSCERCHDKPSLRGDLGCEAPGKQRYTVGLSEQLDRCPIALLRDEPFVSRLRWLYSAFQNGSIAQLFDGQLTARAVDAMGYYSHEESESWRLQRETEGK
jgi:hypothetical protein